MNQSQRKLTENEIKEIDKKHQTLVIHGNKVFNVTKFASVHPGGKNFILNYHGKDVSNMMKNGPHTHSKNAYRWLEQYYVADIVSNKDKSSEEKDYISKEIEIQPMVQKDIVDWKKPMLWQVGNLGAKYHDWVDIPVDKKLRLFKSDFFEFFSNTKWFAIPIVWIPFVVMLMANVFTNHSKITMFQDYKFLETNFPNYLIPLVFTIGVLMWSLVEYVMHRWLFHANPPVESYNLITLHFLLHGQHHKVPFDKGRLVFPPAAASVFVVIFYFVFTTLMPTGVAQTLLAGLVMGYIGYDLTHYYLHYGSPKKGSYFDRLRSYHVRHHFESPELGFGISSKIWDYPFNTLIKTSSRKTK